MRIRDRGEEIRGFILQNIEEHSSDIGKVAAERFRISRQAVNKHLQRLSKEGCIAETGRTRNRSYKLAARVEWRKRYDITPDLAEDIVWDQDIRPFLGQHPENVLDIWHFGFTEMFNNAIDHSGGTWIDVVAWKTATTTTVILVDDGIGIFKKIKLALNLLDERHSVIELAKGKLTTDPKRHTGEGIFFTSRLMDNFNVVSGEVHFAHSFGDVEDWILERKEANAGTQVYMKLGNHTARSTKKVFDQYASEDDYGFTKTVVPVKLAQYGRDKLISRSQAKRLLARVELFKTVMFDFSDIPSVGQAFADEIFRVFAQQHPDIQLLPINANEEVSQMISRAKSVRNVSLADQTNLEFRT
jgi:biotin operon repressor